MLPVTKSGPIITSITQSCKVDNNKQRSQNPTTAGGSIHHDLTDLDCPASMRVCRVCLITDVKMYHLSEHQLGVMYERITSIKINADNKFPRMLCWECAARLSSANLFREKALKSQWILYSKGNNGKVITMRDIISVNRTSSQLESSLGTKFNQEDDFDPYLIDKSSMNTESNEIEGIYIKKEVDPIGFEDLNEGVTDNSVDEENVGIKGEGEVASYDDEDNEMIEEDPIEVGEGSKKSRKRKNKSQMLENSINETQSYIDQQDIGSTSQAAEEEYPEIPLETCLIEDTKDDSLKNILICDFCNKVFSRKTSLQEHMNYKHNKNVSFDCPVCSFSTRIKSCLTRHIKAKHTQSISFHCPHCTFKTYLKSYLDKHVNYKHTKKTSFKCSLCDFETFHQSSLGKHVKCKHTKSACHFCSYCNYNTCDKSNLRKHVSTKHNQ